MRSYADWHTHISQALVQKEKPNKSRVLEIENDNFRICIITKLMIPKHFNATTIKMGASFITKAISTMHLIGIVVLEFTFEYTNVYTFYTFLKQSHETILT